MDFLTFDRDEEKTPEVLNELAQVECQQLGEGSSCTK